MLKIVDHNNIHCSSIPLMGAPLIKGQPPAIIAYKIAEGKLALKLPESLFVFVDNSYCQGACEVAGK